MTLPPGYLIASLLLWAWQHGHWPIALLLGATLEAFRVGLIASRDVSSAERPGNGTRWCAVLSGLGALLVILGKQQGFALLGLFEWLPVLMAPWLLWQYRDHPDGFPPQWWGGEPGVRLRLEVIFALTCWLAASLGNHQAGLFTPGLLVLCGWLLWYHRPGRRRALAFVLMLSLSAISSIGLHSLLVETQTALEAHLLVWISDWWHAPMRDPTRQSTALGQLGELKQSSRIVIRLGPDAGPQPLLLMQASYNILADNTWFTRRGKFQPLPGKGSLRWALPTGPAGEPDKVLTIVQEHSADSELLALPTGSQELIDLPAQQVQINQYGAVQAIDIPSPVVFRVASRGKAFVSGVPDHDDLRVPSHLSAVLSSVISEAGLEGLAAEQVPAAMADFFATQFHYSLNLQGHDLDDFLSTKRFGHCEYFASAAVMLLRQRGIPARYATGYSVQEYSFLEGRMVARQRHAHAWALGFINGEWQTLDVTPSVWFSEEAALAPWWSGLLDVWSWLSWQSRQWPEIKLDARLGVPLLGALMLLWGRLRWRQRPLKTPQGSRQAETDTPGMDSECYRIVNWCSRKGLQRPTGEPLAYWLPLASGVNNPDADQLLNEILQLHYRYRFDPAGLSASERERLRYTVQQWFKQHHHSETHRLPMSVQS